MRRRKRRMKMNHTEHSWIKKIIKMLFTCLLRINIVKLQSHLLIKINVYILNSQRRNEVVQSFYWLNNGICSPCQPHLQVDFSNLAGFYKLNWILQSPRLCSVIIWEHHVGCYFNIALKMQFQSVDLLVISPTFFHCTTQPLIQESLGHLKVI